jgi:hypothetical protein
MHLDRRIITSPGELLPPGIADMHRGGIHAVPVLDATQNAGEIDLLCTGVHQGTVGSGGHERFQWLVKPAIASRAGHPGDRKFQIRPQNIGLVGSSWCTGRHHHRPYQHPEVQFALPRNDSALHA